MREREETGEDKSIEVLLGSKGLCARQECSRLLVPELVLSGSSLLVSGPVVEDLSGGVLGNCTALVIEVDIDVGVGAVVGLVDMGEILLDLAVL